MCALTATACTDTLDEAALPKPLSVDVNARDITARAPIHGTALPDASSIGISLLAEDGTPYDGVTYANLKYTASGTASDQTWSTPNIPTLSSTPAKLVAYYPWADGTDYTAVPVETDSQTDYMYSKWLTGLSNANPNASIVMQHALTAVRVALVKGDFTADVDVSSVSVKSPAFATAGSLDATTGALSGLTGIGEAVTVTADFPLTAQATNVEVMAVPDVNVAAGVTTVTTQIGDRKYSVNINFTESYKQGYIYTYTLTLNNTGMEVTSVAVTPWQEGTTDNGILDVEEPDNKYIVKIQVDENNFEYAHHVVEFIGTIDWGDGVIEEYTSLISSPKHIYTTAGEYTVTCTGKIKKLCMVYVEELDEAPWVIYEEYGMPIITEIIKIGGEMGITDMMHAYYYCPINTLQNGIFDGLTEVTTFEGTFAECEELTNISEGLFDKCKNVTTFAGTFSGCIKLNTIPEGLFDKCPNVTSFNAAFWGCWELTDIPQGLFDNNTKVTNFAQTFYNCSKLTNIPEGLFDNCTEVTDFGGVFSGSDITAIPTGLFDNNINVTDFSGAFDRCDALTSIPEGLFDKNTKVTTFKWTFSNCDLLNTIPDKLFSYNSLATDFYGTFQNCTALTAVPEKLFEGCKSILVFEQTFSYTGLTSIPEGLFNGLTSIIGFDGTFHSCSNLNSIPEGLFKSNINIERFNSTFAGCTALTDIPKGLFNNCTKVKSFNWMFATCTGLINIPTELFDNNTKVTDFNNTFKGCTTLSGESPYTIINVDGTDVKVHLYERSSYPEHFAAITSYASCFYNCTGLTDYANIPGSWK